MVRGERPRARVLRRCARLLVGLGAALAVGGCALDPVPPPAGVGVGAWTTFQGSEGRNPVVSTAGSGADLSAAWRFTTGDSIVAAPSVVHGVAYFGSMDGRLYAVDVATGRQLWSFRADNQIMSEPLVVGGRVFFGSGDKGWSGTGADRVRGAGPSAVYALDAATGREVWAFPTRGEAMPTPAYLDGVVYEPTGGGYLYAIDAATGHLLWRFHVGGIVSMSSPAITGGVAVFGGVSSGPPAYYGVNLRTHRLQWVVRFPSAWAGPDDLSPAVAGGIAYVQTPEGHLHVTVMEAAIRVATGRLLWERSLGAGPANYHGGEAAGIASVVGGVAYVGSPVLRGVWALSAASGRTIWHSPLPVPVRAAPAVDGSHVFVVSAGTMYALSRATGAAEGRLTVGRRPPESNSDYVQIPCASPAVVVAGRTLLSAGGSQNVLEATPVSRLLASTP